jgi:hypothetical protein
MYSTHVADVMSNHRSKQTLGFLSPIRMGDAEGECIYLLTEGYPEALCP